MINPSRPSPDAGAAASAASGSSDRDAAWQLSRDLLTLVDDLGVIRDVNPAWTQLLALRPAQAIGEHLTAFVHPADTEAIRAPLNELEENDACAEFECRLRAANNEYRIFSWTVTRMRGQFFCVARDITAERQRQIALEDSRDFARLALSAVSGVGVWTYEVSSDCFFCDAAISALYGIDPDVAAKGIRRDYFLANVHPEDRQTLRNTMSGGLLQGGDLELEYRICHPDGSIRHVLSRGHTYFNEHGLPQRRTGVGIDTTAQRELEQQLRQSQKMEAVGQLTGGLAHDFNNMLQGVVGPLELMRHLIAKGKTGELERFIGMAITSARRAAALTHRLLAFSRKQPLAPRSADVRLLIPPLKDLISQKAHENIAIEFDTGTQPCQVRCDTNQLESALLNLSINACDAMPDGGALTIATSVVDVGKDEALRHEGAASGRYVRVSVSDTGSGMSHEVASQVFQPFFTTKPIGQGTGLGLSMVYGFVRQSGGFVTIDSSVGRGTTVSLLLPETNEATQVERSQDPAANHKEGAGETVLIVDDDETIRQLLAEFLDNSGYLTITAHDGPSGLAILTSNTKIDLLICDVRLPGLNGRQMADAGRIKRSGLPVLFITGYAEEAAADGFLAENMAMLTKPFSMQSLQARASEMLKV